MTWPYAYGQTVEVLDGSSDGQRDSDGNRVPSWAVKAVYEQVAVVPADANASGANEYLNGRDLVITGKVAFFPPDAVPPAAIDRVRVGGPDGDVYEVQGQPDQYVHPETGWAPGMPVALRKVTG